VSSAEGDLDGRTRVSGLREGLRELGWVEGRDLRLEVRYGAGDARRIREAIDAFVASAPDLIVVNSTPALDVVFRATRTIPVVFALAVDPVALGYVQTMARPGANITGFTFWNVSLMGKWLQLLKETVPSVERATIIHNPETTPFYPQMIEAARRLPGLPSVSLAVAPVREPAEIPNTITEIARLPGGSVIAPSDPFITRWRAEVAAACLAHRLPSIAIFRNAAEAGGLMSYGPDVADVFKRAASYVDRILKGAKPGDLPVQEPTIFEFVINAGTARKLGLTVPPNVLAAANEVLE
jgi:putative ABC transport system substrate-binding protein